MPTPDDTPELPAIDAIAALELYGDGYEPEAVLENRPGNERVLAVYYHVAIRHGGLTPAAARQALELLAEPAAQARMRPGAQPHIDRLYAIVEQALYYSVKAVPKTAA